MTREVEAIFEAGVLRPVEPLPFAEKQRVQVTVSDLPNSGERPAARELELQIAVFDLVLEGVVYLFADAGSRWYCRS